MKAKQAVFRIDGEDFTQLARDMFLSRGPAHAYRFILRALAGGKPGEAEHFAPQILDGTKKLIGNETDGMEPADDNATDYIKQIRWLYAGRVRLGNCWWRPRAEVTAFGEDDAAFANKGITPEDEEAPSIAEGRTVISRWWCRRVAFYAREGERVVQVKQFRKPSRTDTLFKVTETAIIFEPTTEPPFWWPENATPNDALDDFFKAGQTLHKEGHVSRPVKKKAKALAVAEAFTAAFTPDEDQDAKEARQEAAYRDQLEDIRRRVVEQAGDDTFELSVEGKTLTVPRAPFEQWALGRTSLKHLAAPWECISPVGLKLPLDDPYHSDWLIGAGCDLNQVYSGPINDAAFHELAELQERLGNFMCGVVVDGGPVSGTIGKEIVVLPDLRPDFLEAMVHAKAVITETGGKLAHLAQVALEKSITILLVPDAISRFPEGTSVSLEPATGFIRTFIRRR